MSLRRIVGIMNKYNFRTKVYLDIEQVRDIKLDMLLGKKNKKGKPTEIFFGVTPNSKEHYERKEVFDYFYKEGKTDLEIQTMWLGIQKEKVKRGKNYNF
jgi:hypothetical protein